MIRKKIKIFFLMPILLISLFVVNSSVRAIMPSVEVTIHFYRFDNDYSGWDVWAWVKNEEGTAEKFTGEDSYGKYTTFTKTNIHEDPGVGFIIRKEDWSAREEFGDRYIPLDDKVVGNKISVWIIQADKNIYYSAEEVDKSPRFLGASFKTIKTIGVTGTQLITATDTFDVYENNAKLTNTSVSFTKNTATITLANNADINKSYKVVSNTFGEMAISLFGLYSTKEFEDAFTYNNNDLGANYTKTQTVFKTWAPVASSVVLNIYTDGHTAQTPQTHTLQLGDKGVWSTTVTGDLNKKYYTYSITNNGITNEVADIYGKAAGANGNRSMVIDFQSTNPQGFRESKGPALKNYTDAVIYETHIREFTIHESSGVKAENRGKYKGMVERGTKNSHGQSTGLDHLVELGITELHILPMFDYASVDEEDLVRAQFNWGYDPKNYNVPEGSYSSDPFNGEVRVKELKEMVQGLHEAGIRVIMDVVYNHTYASADSFFNLTVPGYFYRMSDTGNFLNGSGCGNETASERSMFRNFMIQSIEFWATEYKIDGFRFDLMALHDIKTMNLIREACDKINPDIMLYGEGWDAGTNGLPVNQRATKANAKQLNGIAVFNDDIRDGVKGGVWNGYETGFIQGNTTMKERVKFGVVGANQHGQVNYGSSFWAKDPNSSINYVSAHDNNTLWDKINLAAPDESLENKILMNKLAAAIVFTSQGVPFFTAGEEILRTKPIYENGVPTGEVSHNSYNLPDETNQIMWDTKNDYIDVFNFYKGLISLRKAIPAFRMSEKVDIFNIYFYPTTDNNVIGFIIDYTVEEENGKTTNYQAIVYYNATKNEQTFDLPETGFDIYMEDGKCTGEVLRTEDERITVGALSATIAIKTNSTGGTNPNSPNLVAIIVIASSSVVLLLGASYFVLRKRKALK